MPTFCCLYQPQVLTMTVDLKNMPDISIRPSPPKPVRWIVALIILIGLSIVISRLVSGKNHLWLTVGLPALAVSGLLFMLLVIYLVRAIFANARDREREKMIIREVRRGRRALQILAAECCTAHSSADNPFTAIGSNLVKNEDVFFPQRSWRGEEDTHLSQIIRAEGLSEAQHFRTLLSSLIQRLVLPLSVLPSNRPVMVLLEHSSALSEEKAFALFWQAWHQAGILQPVSTFIGNGAQAIDDWLDHHFRSEAVLLVVSWQYAPANTPLSAETVNAVLLGNRLTQGILPPLAYLHRPEPGEATTDAQHYAITQALDWVPVNAEMPAHLWLTGMLPDSEEYVTLLKVIDAVGLENVDQQTGFHNFNNFLGDPGKSALWLAVAAATQSIQRQPEYHLLINREQQNGKVWNMIVSPATPVKEREA